MPIAVTGKFMPTGVDLAHQLRETGRHPTQKEESPFGLVSFKKIQDAFRVFDHPVGPPIPTFPVNIAGKSLYLKVVLHVYSQDMGRRLEDSLPGVSPACRPRPPFPPSRFFSPKPPPPPPPQLPH